MPDVEDLGPFTGMGIKWSESTAVVDAAPDVTPDAKPFGVAVRGEVAAACTDDVMSRAYSRLHQKAVIVTVWYLASFAVAATTSSWVVGLAALTSLALAMAAVGFCIQHDANHNAFFKAGSKRLSTANRAMGWSMYALGASAERWIDGHVLAHHSGTNIVGRDWDIELGPLARLAPSQRRRRWHRAQHLYLWPIYAFTAAGILVGDLASGLTEVVTGDRHGRRPTARSVGLLVASKMGFVAVMAGVPLALGRPWWAIALGAAWTLAIVGTLLGLVFQAAHVVTDAEFSDAALPESVRWHEWQVRSTVDFAHGHGPLQRALTWYIGGLNYQIEHHLFPRLPHTVYPQIAPVVAATCRAYGIPYRVAPSFRSAIGSHYRHLRAMSH